MQKLMCKFVGWNYDLFKQCGEASLRILKTYTCALLIVMTIWFTIGFVFSQRYIGIDSIVGRICMGCVFALIVYMIEKIIILHISGKGVVIFRTILAVCMALLGSFIFDQLVFRNDLEKAIRKQERIEIVKENEDKITSIQNDINKLKNENDSLYNEIAKHPTIQQVSTSTRTVPTMVDSNGIQQYRKVTDITTSHTSNPLQELANANDQRIKNYQMELQKFRGFDVDKEVEKRVKDGKTGFLEELKASLGVISNSWISIFFYFILFFFMLCLELFVVSIKLFKSKKCEYDLITEHQLKIKELQLKNAWENINNKYVTKQME